MSFQDRQDRNFGIIPESFQQADVVCYNCKGSGKENMGSIKVQILCHICGGEGKLDWLERLFGKVNKEPISIICNDRRRYK